ncbi:MAG: nitrilase-related carbon-nitrogen hydrolase [Desulfurobacteriaceae bacterium]
MKIAVAQIRTKLGEVKDNVEKCIHFSEKAKEEGAELIVFPELSLTGYNLQDLTFEVALTPESKELIPLLELSREISIVVGLIEESPEHIFYNSAFHIEGGKVKHVHRKLYLPTYGMFDEGRFTGHGEEVKAFNSKLGKTSILICEDLWHFSTVYLSFIQGTEYLIALSSSPGRGYRERGMFGNAEVWLNMGEFYSRLTGSYFIYSNRVGVEDGFVFSGKSFVCDPYGKVVAQAGSFNEELLIVEVEPTLIRSARVNLPLLRDERPLTTLKNLRRIVDEG